MRDEPGHGDRRAARPRGAQQMIALRAVADHEQTRRRVHRDLVGRLEQRREVVPRAEAAHEPDPELTIAETQTLLDATDELRVGSVEERRVGPVGLHVHREALGRQGRDPVGDLFRHGDRTAARREPLRERRAGLRDAVEVAMTRGLDVERRVHFIDVRHPGLGGRKGALGREQREPLDHQIGIDLREVPVEFADGARLPQHTDVQTTRHQGRVRLGRAGRRHERGDFMTGAQQRCDDGTNVDGFGPHSTEGDVQVGEQHHDPHGELLFGNDSLLSRVRAQAGGPLHLHRCGLRLSDTGSVSVFLPLRAMWSDHTLIHARCTGPLGKVNKVTPWHTVSRRARRCAPRMNAPRTRQRAPRHRERSGQQDEARHRLASVEPGANQIHARVRLGAAVSATIPLERP